MSNDDAVEQNYLRAYGHYLLVVSMSYGCGPHAQPILDREYENMKKWFLLLSLERQKVNPLPTKQLIQDDEHIPYIRIVDE
jgi:hypothetical protein